MIEIPEAVSLSKQLKKEIKGKKIKHVIAGQSPHKFAWFFNDDPSIYDERLKGKTVGDTKSYGGRVVVEIEDMRFEFADGVNILFVEAGKPLPKKHQLLIEFEDGSALVASVQMYGGLWAYADGEFENEYSEVARKKINPLSDAFDFEYFEGLLAKEDLKKLSAKAFLATEQRIPGFGNGVLQDILLNALVNPRSKMSALTDVEIKELFAALKSTLRAMVDAGGRDTEKDIYGSPGRYKTLLSKNNKELVCPVCGGHVKKEAFMGGSVYYCINCQPIKR